MELSESKPAFNYAWGQERNEIARQRQTLAEARIHGDVAITKDPAYTSPMRQIPGPEGMVTTSGGAGRANYELLWGRLPEVGKAYRKSHELRRPASRASSPGKAKSYRNSIHETMVGELTNRSCRMDTKCSVRPSRRPGFIPGPRARKGLARSEWVWGPKGPQESTGCTASTPTMEGVCDVQLRPLGT